MLIDHPAPSANPPAATYGYHWSLPRQRAFLEYFAQSGSVSRAAAHVGVSPRAAYALRHRRDGLLFAVGWGAAVLLARLRLADLLLERAIDGVEEVAVRTATAEDGSAEIRRRKYDGRLGMALLTRLDRMAGEAAEADLHEAALHRAVAQDFESFLDRLAPPHAEGGDTPDDASPADNAPSDAPSETPSDAEARVAAHLAAQVEDGTPLARLARDSGIHCELARKSAVPPPGGDKARPAWTPRRPTDERAHALRRQIHDLLDSIEDQRAAAGLAPIDIAPVSLSLAGAMHELAGLPEETLLAFTLLLREEFAPYCAQWRPVDPAGVDPDSECARVTAPGNIYASVERRREDSIKGRIDRLIVTGRARAVPPGEDADGDVDVEEAAG
jgi:hypothetical protein